MLNTASSVSLAPSPVGLQCGQSTNCTSSFLAESIDQRMLSGLASILNQVSNVALLASWFAPSLFDFMNLGVNNPLSNSPNLPANHQLSPENRPAHPVTLAA